MKIQVKNFAKSNVWEKCRFATDLALKKTKAVSKIFQLAGYDKGGDDVVMWAPGVKVILVEAVTSQWSQFVKKAIKLAKSECLFEGGAIAGL